MRQHLMRARELEPLHRFQSRTGMAHEKRVSLQPTCELPLRRSYLVLTTSFSPPTISAMSSPSPFATPVPYAGSAL